MKVTNVQSPHQVKQVTTNETASRAKAVQAFNQAAQTAQVTQVVETHQQPVTQAPIPVDPNKISVEDLSAVQGQNRSTVDTRPATEQTQSTEEKPAQPSTASQEYQLLARKERQLRQQSQQIQQQNKAKEQQWATEKANLEARLAELEKNTISRQRLKEQPFDVLNDEGITYDEITQQAMDNQQKNPRYESYIRKLEAKIQKLEQDGQRRDTEAQESSTRQYKAAITQITTDAKQLIDTDPNFEMIKATNSVKDVVELIEVTYKQDGRVMTVEEAALEVEQYLLDESIKLANTKKVKERIAVKPATTQPSLETQQNKQTQPVKTLTNAASTTRKLSSKERAVLAFRGELKS